MKKKILALVMAVAMMGTLVACGGGSSSSSSSNGTKITIFNSKSEIQSQFEEMAEKYSEEKGVDVEVYYSSDTVSAHLATKYSSNDPYTISMVDAKDVYSLAGDHAIDLSDQDWVSNTDYAISVDDKVVGFPVCIEARGLMYNADAIEKITGETFDPSKYETLDAFEGLLKQLVAGGMEAPTGIMKEDWSLGAHYLQEVYEEQDDVDAFVQSLYDGKANLAKNDKFNSLMDTFDVLMKYNYAASSPVAAERETSEQKLASGEIAFMFGGNWDWSLLKDYEASDNMGMMPVPQNTDDGTNEKLVGGGSKYFFIDSSDNTSDEQREAAKDFLNWLVNDEEGNSFLTNDCALVPAFNNIDASGLDPLSLSVKAYADKGALVPNYDYDPDDHYSQVGASMQKYLAGELDRAGFASAIEKYWSSTTPVEK
jgi:raffinose/stachyose/melibiose transport system substrate-binding protein